VSPDGRWLAYGSDSSGEYDVYVSRFQDHGRAKQVVSERFVPDRMKYVALLRGVNVGGRNIMSMAALKQCLEQTGLANVRTFIQSGNVIFESGEKRAATLAKRIESTVAQTLGIDSRIVLLSRAQLKTVVADAPAGWTQSRDLRCNIAFLRSPVTANEVLKVVDVKPGIDSVKAGKGVVYMSTLLRGLQKSGLRKLVGTAVYREMTIRTYGTCLKILALMEEPIADLAARAKVGEDR
jgi:uncharacterized protein (DUF1697 family)